MISSQVNCIGYLRQGCTLGRIDTASALRNLTTARPESKRRVRMSVTILITVSLLYKRHGLERSSWYRSAASYRLNAILMLTQLVTNREYYELLAKR